MDDQITRIGAHMHLFIFDVVTMLPSGCGEDDGSAIIWVDSAVYPDAENAARVFANDLGLIVRTVQSARRPTVGEVENMPLKERAARIEALRDGVWGYFAPLAKAQPIKLPM